MLSRMIGKSFLQFISAAALSFGALLAFQPNSFAGDQDMNVIAHAVSGPLACEIRKTIAGTSVQLTGVVSSSVAVTGNARFILMKSGPSGTSNVNQGNAFDLAAGSEKHVSHVTIGLRHDDHATVEFVATSKDGNVCHATAILEL